jgi:glycosyltransferase involved in cell wall biosynthesis
MRFRSAGDHFSMRIGISTRGLNQGSFAISSIIYHLTQAIIDLASKDHEIFLYFNDPRYAALFERSVCKRSIKLDNRFIWDHLWLPKALREDRIDSALFMKGTMPLMLPCKGAVIYHDMGYFHDKLRPYKFAETLYMKRMMALAGRRAHKIFADSEFTRKEAIRFLGIDPGKIRVCYPSCASIYHPVEDAGALNAIRERYRLPSAYIFSPTSLSPRKNYERILDAFENIQSQVPHHLVITGGQSWRARDLIRRIETEFDQRVRVLGAVPQEHMPALYQMASFTIYPSLLEGFGFPILEAFRCNSPVLTSNVTSMPEVAGGAAYLVDPYDTDQIRAGMMRLATDEALRKELIRRGIERAKDFSWENSASVILEQLANS